MRLFVPLKAPMLSLGYVDRYNTFFMGRIRLDGKSEHGLRSARLLLGILNDGRPNKQLFGKRHRRFDAPLLYYNGCGDMFSE